MFRLVFIIYVVISFSAESRTTIEINLKIQHYPVLYYKPFDGFGNGLISTELLPNTEGRVLIDVEIDRPTFVRLFLKETSLWLLLEPGDKITIDKFPQVRGEPLEGVYIHGNNESGHLFYNKYYNYSPIDKVLGVREIFERDEYDVDTIFEKLKLEFERQIAWTDSLSLLNQITEQYSAYMKTEIKSVIAWEVGNLCDNHFQGAKFHDELVKIKAKLFSLIDPLDEKMYTCGLASGYWYTYYEFLYYENKVNADTSQVIIEPYYILAPLKVRKYMWAELIVRSSRSSPFRFNYCHLIQRFKTMFKEGDYINHFETRGFCRKKKPQPEFTIFASGDKDLFRLIDEDFYKKRVLIDLWATWCAPCKIEFAYYDSSLYEFLKKKKISPVFLSIDKLELKDKWEREIKLLNLKGYHGLAGSTLQASIREVVFNDSLVSIPRYILIDENGRIVSVNFKRPSDPLFRQEIQRFFQD